MNPLGYIGSGPWFTRIAPSPTGDMHLGTARTAYFNWLAARASGGTFTLRIDDTDVNRNRQECVDVIFKVLEWLDLKPDRVVYQSSRLQTYSQAAEDLVEKGLAHRDPNGAVLLDAPSEGLPGAWRDVVAGEVKITNQDFEIARNLVLMKGDGNPTYNFASVVDDIELGVNLVLRGKDHTGNTSKQVILWDLIGSPLPTFAHVGLLHENGAKLSKRSNGTSMLKFLEDGYDPDAVLNYMLRMGWGPTVDDKTTAVLPRDRALELFLSGGKVRNSSANLNPDMLDSYDRKYKARKLRAG